MIRSLEVRGYLFCI